MPHDRAQTLAKQPEQHVLRLLREVGELRHDLRRHGRERLSAPIDAGCVDHEQRHGLRGAGRELDEYQDVEKQQLRLMRVQLVGAVRICLRVL